jgi:hypothetical protein
MGIDLKTMQYWESILKNDAILGIDTKKRCNIEGCNLFFA